LASQVEVTIFGPSEYAGELAYAQSGVAVAKSFIYRTHAVTFKTLPPQTRHRGL